MTKHIILLGGGGHCKSCIEVIEGTNEYKIVGILDKKELVGTEVMGYKIVGTDSDIEKYFKKGCSFLVTIGQIKSAKTRKIIYKKLISLDADLPVIISKNAYVSPSAKIGKGTIIMGFSYVNADVCIGENTIINTGCLIEHDAIVGSHTHISTKAIMNGDSCIGDEAFLGSGAIISNQTEVGNRTIIGAGSIVLNNFEDDVLAAGNPARWIKNL